MEVGSIESVYNVEDSVKKIISSSFKISIDSINNELSYQSIPQWDSLSHISLMLELENSFDIKVGSEAVDLINFREIVNFVEHKLKDCSRQTKKYKPFTNSVKINRGLNNIIFDETKISLIDGVNGRLLYRGYDILDLSENCLFEEVIYLIIYGYLPTDAQLKKFISSLKLQMVLDNDIISLIHLMKSSDPINILCCCMILISNKENDNPREDAIISILGKLPIISKTISEFNSGKKNSVNFDFDSYSQFFLENFLQRKCSNNEIDIFNKNMILQAEHSSNASAFVARVSASTKTNMFNSLAAAISAFSGSLHGGAISCAFEMLKFIKENDINIENYIQDKMKKNEPIYGFGHRVYKVDDPRALVFKDCLNSLCKEKEEFEWISVLNGFYEAMKQYRKLGLGVNVDYYSSAIYDILGIHKNYFTFIFAVGRMPGWIAHIVEQYKSNILIRPKLQYVGEDCLYVSERKK